MLQKLIQWLMGFQYRRKAQALLMDYKHVESDNHAWLGSFFIKQEEFLKSGALKDVYVNRLPTSLVYIYYNVAETKQQLKNFLMQLRNNDAINVTALQEFRMNSRSASIHGIFEPDVDLRTQLLEINELLNEIIQAYEKQTGSFKSMNLSRIIPLFEMFAIIVNRVTEGYLATS